MSDSFKKLIGMLMHLGIAFDYGIDFFENHVISNFDSADIWRIHDDSEHQSLLCIINEVVFTVPYDSYDGLNFVIESITKCLTSC